MTAKHVYHDGKGEVRIYAALPGCRCAWCESQRKQAAKPYSAAPAASTAGDATWQEVANLLAKRGAQLAREHGVPISQGNVMALAENPELAKFYSQGDSLTDGTVHSYSDVGGSHRRGHSMTRTEAGQALDRRAKSIQGEERGLTYAEALNKAMKAMPDMAAAYNDVWND